MLNDLLFGRFKTEVETKVIEPIRELVTAMKLDDKVTITTEVYDGYPDCDEMQVIVHFADKQLKDDGFSLTYDLYYGEDKENKRDVEITLSSDILRGITGNYGGVCWPQKEIKFDFANLLSPLDDELAEDVVISGLLLKEYVLDNKLYAVNR